MRRVVPAEGWGLWPRLAVVLTVGFLFLFSIFSVLSLQAVHDSTERILQERLVVAEMAAGEIDALLQRAYDELESATEFAPFDPRTADLTTETHALAHASSRLGSLSLGVAFLDETGRTVLTVPNSLAPPAADWLPKPYIRRALATHQRQISAPFVDPRTNRPAVAVAIPVADEAGRPVSLLAGLIDLSTPEVVQLLDRAQQLGHSGHALIVDDQARVVASTEPGGFLQSGEHPEFYRRMLAAWQSGIESTPTNEAGEGNHIMAFVPLNTVRWAIAVGGDEAETLAPVHRLRNGILVLGVLSLVAVLGATLFGTRQLVRPVKDLTTAAQRIAAGDLEHPIAIGEGGEIGLLARNLEAMRRRLAATISQIQTWNDELEGRVRQRTAELDALNKELQAQEEVRRRLLARVITAQEEERIRIAQELHDETAQVLTSLAMKLKSIERSQPPEAVAARERLARLRVVAEQAVVDVRRLIGDLRPAVLDELGLVAAIRSYAENRLAPMGVDFALHSADPATQRLPDELETVLFRIAQEAIGNVARHARAGRVDVTFEYDAGRLRLVVEDDGAGFHPRVAGRERNGARGLGLAGMRERAALVGGRVHVHSRPGHGTRIEVKVPSVELVTP